jgi:hypothetical protein
MRTVFDLKFNSGAHACAYRFTYACAYSCVSHPCRLIFYC